MRRVGLLVTLAILVVTGVWWMFLISPKNDDIADLEQELTGAIDTEQRLRVQINELETIRQAEVEYLAGLGRLDALIPQRPLLEDFIEQIYELTTETGVELQTLAPSIPSSPDDSELREVAVSVQIEGKFFELLGFLFGLNDMERLVRVDSIAVSSTLDDVGGTILSVSIEIKLFTLADLLPILDEVRSLTPDELPDDGEGDLETLGGGL
ncbi:MAG: type 4a pilus biogenesis protein PilO [Acidimicrobiia bacterium]